MVAKLHVVFSCLALVIFGGCGGSSSSGARCVPGASVDCACGTNQHGAQTCTAQGTYSACVCAGPTVDASSLGGIGGNTSGGTGGQGDVSSDAGVGGTGGVGGVTISSTSNGGSGGYASSPPDTSMGGSGGAGGTTVPVTSNGGAGGAGGTTLTTTSNGGVGGAGGVTLTTTSNGGSGGAGGVTLTTTSNGGSGGAGGTTSSAICGNGKMEGGEGCDDGNKMPFDGCSSDCQIEPDCSGTSCASACGDGLVFGNEECDDGNHANGDGCSADCKIESGWNCTQPPVGNKIMVPVVYRDFRFHNPSDFEAGVVGAATASVGMVNPDLDKDGKPVYTGLTGAAIHVESQSTFSQWYRNTDGVNHATPAKMALWDNGQGGYVNRYGANGEQWNLTQTAYFCGTKGLEILDADGQAIPCTCSVSATTDCDTLLAAGEQMLKCYLDRYYGVTWEATFLVAKMDGNPLFFPVDDDSFTPASELTAARIPPLYDATMTWPFDVDDAGNNRLHNFSFTSEVRYWFKYEAGKTYQLDFVGDDDVWVFINRKLAVDMGGIHMPVSGSITLDATTAARLGGLKDGKLYEIAVFQAERQTSGSSYKLTLTGFNTASSQCSPL